MTSILLALIILLLLIFLWMMYTQEKKPASVIAVTLPPGTLKSGEKKEGFDPRYDRTFHQSILDVYMDKTRDPKGYTVDDYLLGDLLYRQHSSR